MVSPIVIDASLALAWVLDEPQPDWARHLREQAEGRLVDLRVPTAFWLEVDNILVRQPGTTHDQMLEGVLRLDSLGLTDVELDRPMRLRSLELAFRHRLTTYDAVYLALAVDLGVRLATLDAQLGRAASSHDLRYGDDHGAAVRERWPTYGADQTPDPISLAAIGAYIARFREPLEPDRDTNLATQTLLAGLAQADPGLRHDLGASLTETMDDLADPGRGVPDGIVGQRVIRV